MHTKQHTTESYAYLQKASSREPELMKTLREETAQTTHFVTSTAEQGQFLHLLIRLVSAESVLELGTLTGYATSWMAMALGPGGHLDTCDISTKFTTIAQRYWKRMALENKITLHISPALKTLSQFNEEARLYDVIYLDADKKNYVTYYENCLGLLRPGGLLVIDNTFWHGHPADPNIQDPATKAIRNLNRRLKNDVRIELASLSLYDGMTLVYKK